MSTQVKCLLFALVIAVVFADMCKVQIKTPIYQEILNNFKGDFKSMFKAWHFIFDKTYNYNTEEGLKRFKIFKQNAKDIEAFNSLGKSYTKGLNHLADMTDEEIKEYYNLKPLSIPALRKSLRQLNSFNLDDYNDEEDIIPDYQDKKKVRGLNASDHRSLMRAVRDQSQCGSCWAFATTAIIEGHFSKVDKSKKDWFSPQQSVDCDNSNGGCNGGWYDSALRFYVNNEMMYENDYKYTAKKGSLCMFDQTKSSGYKLTGYDSYYADYQGKRDVFESMINNGPTAVAVDANSEWSRYSGGVLGCKCSPKVNHAVVVVGWQPSSECTPAHWIVRNSWGERWGEQGHVRVADEDSNFLSCGIERFAFAPKGFVKTK